MNPYARFAAMIATSTVAMFGLMYLNTLRLDHVFFSETRICAVEKRPPETGPGSGARIG